MEVGRRAATKFAIAMAAGLASAVIGAQGALAQASVQINLSAAVPATCTFTGLPAAGATVTVPVTGGVPGGTDLTGSVTEKCNNKNGYTVAVKSDNAAAIGGATKPRLVSSDAANLDYIEYDVAHSVGGSPTTFSGYSAGVANVSLAKTNGTGITSKFTLTPATTAPSSFPASDTYTDKLTFTYSLN